MLKHRLWLLAPVSSMVQRMAVGEPSSSSGMIVSTETEYRGPLLTVILDTASGAGLRRNIRSVTIGALAGLEVNWN